MEIVSAHVPDNKIRNGCTKPYYITCDDGEQYAVKFKENPESCRVLINEYICGKIALLLDLPLAEPRLVFADEGFIQDHGEVISNHVGENITTGHHFGSKKIKKTFQIFNSQMIEQADNIKCVPEIILFDHLICNNDRDSNGGNLLFDATNKQIVMIDHTHAFDLGPIWTAHELKRRIKEPIISLETRGYVYKKLVPFVKGNHPFDVILNKISSLNYNILWNIIKDIPEDWIISYEEKSILVEYLLDRASRIEEVLPRLKPYLPYWKGGI